MKPQRITKGSILQIPVETYYCYAQILDKANYAFFDYKSSTPLDNLEILTTKKILFVISVFDRIITSGEWEKVGKLPIREELQVLPNKYIHHKNETPEYELYNTETGVITPSSIEGVKGLEKCAVWDSHHVIDRIRCHYTGNSCLWLSD